MKIHDALDRAIDYAVRDPAPLGAARARFADLAGRVYDDEPLYEERSTAFLEWYALDDKRDGARRPVLRLLDETPANDPLRPALVAVATAHRSLFSVRERTPDGVLLDDLWGGALFRVSERRRTDGLDAGELFEARLAADVEPVAAGAAGVDPASLRVVFTRAFSFHPREAAPAIRAEVARARAAGETRETLLFHLLRLRVRCERYRHVPPARVYEQEMAGGSR